MNAWKSVPECIVLQAELLAKVAYDFTKPGIKVCKVPDHMSADMTGAAKRANAQFDLRPKFRRDFIQTPINVLQGTALVP